MSELFIEFVQQIKILPIARWSGYANVMGSIYEEIL